MPKQNLKSETLPTQVAHALELLGANITTARVRRGLRLADLAQKTGLAPGTLQRVERGSPTTAISAYFTVLWALGLEPEFSALAAPERDLEGMTLERARAPQRVHVKEDLDADF